MDIQELAMTAARAALVYVVLLVVVRLLGKRTIGNFTAFDLLVAFIISEVVDEIIYGDVPLVQGFLPIAIVAGLHYLNSVASYLSPAFEKLTGGSPRVLVRAGKMDRKAMAAERVSEDELRSLLREKEIDDLSEVELATLEVNGQLSVIKTDESKELQKGDLDSLLDTARRRPAKSAAAKKA